MRPPSRRGFLKSAGLLAGAQVIPAAPARRPNLVFIAADGWREASFQDLRIPNLQSLAQQGARFDRLYACYPSSAPARAALISGRFPRACGVPRDGVRLPVDQPSIAEQLKRAGYRTGYIGEWRLDGAEEPGFVPPGPRRHGFDFWAAFNRGHRYFDSIYFRDSPEPLHRTGFEPDYQTDLAIDFIKQSDQKPFYLFLAWGPPHPPLTPPPGARQLYNPGSIRVRANVPSGLEESAQASYAGYHALCSALDDNLGRLLGALADQHLAGGTIMVFTSGSGSMLGSQGLEGDDQPFEEAVRVPLIVRYPGAIEAGGRNNALVSTVDLMPTLLKFCGADVPGNVQGQDIAVHRESIYCSGKLDRPEEWRMVVQGLDKLVVDRDLNVTHLYNLGQDPYELENLARDGAQDLKRDELKALLKDWMRRSGDGMDPSGLKKRAP